MTRSTDALVLGGGLAGLTAALHLARAGADVTVVEKGRYPRHKVCGEYVAGEVLPYLERLGVPLDAWQPRRVRRFRLHAPSGRWVEAPLARGGIGLRRYTLEHGLFRLAEARGVRFALGTAARDVEPRGGRLRVRADGGAAWEARCVIGAFGRRSRLDDALERRFARRPAQHVGVKLYVRRAFPPDLVALYGFDGGYAGAVRVEDGTVDVAYLARAERLRAAGGLAAFEERVLRANPALRELLDGAERTLERPLAIANVSFARKEPVRGGVLMVGDAAGSILPLSGNGMALGVHAAKLAAEAVALHLAGRLDRAAMERRFARAWRRAFARRIAWGRRLHPLLERPRVAEAAVAGLRHAPAVLPALVRRTHGRPVA